MTTLRFVWIAAFALGALIGSPLTSDIVLGDEVDSLLSDLAAARVRYEAEMERQRIAVREAVAKHDEGLRRNPDPAAIQSLKDALQQFEATGAYPSIAGVEAIAKRVRKAERALQDAYERAEKACWKQKQDSLAESLKAERERMSEEQDIVPFGDNLVALIDERKQVAGGVPCVVPINVEGRGAYRLEIVAKRVAGGGTLVITLPLPDGRRCTAHATGAVDDVRLLLSVRDELISADLGVTRPIAAAVGGEESPRSIALAARDGAFHVTSLRIKPILDAEPEQAANPDDKAAPRREAPAKPDPAAGLTKGSTWSGKRIAAGFGEIRVTATVVKRSDNDVEIKTPTVDGVGSVFWVLKVKGDRLHLTGMRYSGNRSRSYADVSGEGKIEGDQLKFEYRCRFKTAKRNTDESGTMNLTRD